MSSAVRLLADTYLDSVVQMAGSRAMRQVEGVEWAAVAMATPANVETLRDQGFDAADLAGAGAGDLVLAVRAADGAAVDAAFDAGRRAMFTAREPATGAATGAASAPPRSLDDALREQPDSTVAVISVPGDYAALEAHKALARGLDVLLFSDNVSVEDEIALKEHAAARGHLLMGPGAGTALLGGVGLGFSNAVRQGPVGVLAAAGTGAQEAMALLDRWGSGVSQVIGLGGRDLSEAVDGRMAAQAMRVLCDDPETEVILLVSKPPAQRVARRILAGTGKPVIAALIGLSAGASVPEGAVVTDTIEAGVAGALARLGSAPPDPTRRHGPGLGEVLARLAPTRTTVRGLYSGGTLCYEALVLLGRALGPVWSNTPIDKRHGLPAPASASVCLDLGEEEYTRGRPHPMIDPEARIGMLRDLRDDPEVAVVLLDVVLGHGSHPDPAGMLAPVCAELAGPDGPQVVAYVLGTEGDPQGYHGQVRALVEAGCVVTETAARAALTAAAIACRDATIAAAPL
jgi:FdrA protein